MIFHRENAFDFLQKRRKNKAGQLCAYMMSCCKEAGPDLDTEVVKYEDRYRKRSFSSGAESGNY